ncbi:MAG: branched-chain amino acid ABC transporter permease [Burkholderiales bacterium]|jgi:branched-chain amino acid transport system permease protein
MIDDAPSAGRIRWGWFIAWVILMAVLPLVFDDTQTLSLMAITALAGLSLALMWGYAGILSFGHAAYFGLGAYTYAIAAVNFGESTVPVLLSILVPALLAAAIGAMMFWGRIGDVYLGVITLVVSLILFKFMNATAGDAYKIGEARLGGFNGIPGFQILNVPGDPSAQIFGLPFYYVTATCLALCYLLCRWILSTAFGRTLVGIRENELRVELLGYDVPAHKTVVFTIGAGMAGLSGAFFAMWAEIVTPGVFALGLSAEMIVWVIAGGLGTLIGPMMGAAALTLLKLMLGQQTMIDNSLVLGAIMVIVVLLIPKGIVPTVAGWRGRRERSVASRRGQASGRKRRAPTSAAGAGTGSAP